MKSEKALDYIDRLSNLNDKCYTRIVATKAIEIAIEDIMDKVTVILDKCGSIDEFKNELSLTMHHYHNK